MTRRQFLKTGAIAAALAGAGRLPMLSAQTGSDASIDAATGPHALKPIRDHLRRFLPAEVPLGRSGNYRLTYDIVHWNWVGGRQGTYANSVLGQVTIERKADSDRVIYDVNQRTRIGGADNFLDARIICEANDLNSLRKWTLSSYSKSVKGQLDPHSKLDEAGRCDDGRIRIESDDHNYEFAAKNPVVTQWTVLDLLIRKANPTLDVEFDLLQDLSLFKPNQALVYDAVTPLELRGGRTLELQTYSQTGQGVLPIHYLLDDHRRPQLITNSILSWALTQSSH
ncbi:MAG: twin-arginine translocation signal domain-containing protein [Planctomycetota bacterium]